MNALTEVYGAAGAPFMPGGYGRGAGSHQGGAAGGAPPFHGREIHNHSGMSYHAPGPDGQPWLHLRGPGGQPAPNWNSGNLDAPADSDNADRSGQLPLWQDPSFMYPSGGHLPMM
jgi:hypothetical protein